MTRGAPAGFLTTSQAPGLAPIWLLRLATGLAAPNDTIRICTANRTITFPTSGGSTYAPRPVEIPEIVLGTDAEGGGGSTLRLGDADSYWHGLGASWAGKRVSILRTDADLLSAGTNVIWNDFFVDGPEWDHGRRELLLTLLPFRSKLRRLIAPDLVTRAAFPGVP